MKKKVICTFCLTLTALLLPCFALAQTDPNWLVGNWTGTIFTTDKTRYLNIISTDKGVEAQGAYGVTGGKLVPVSIKVEGTKVEFTVPTTESQIALVKATETRMDGTFTNKGGKKFNVRFWKIPHTNPPSLDPLMGEWKGQWKVGNNPPQTRFVIEFADTAVASVLYEWSDFVDGLGVSYKAGWWRKDAKILSERSIEFENIHSTEGKLVFRFDLKEGALKGRINNGWEDINTIVMSRTK